MSSVTWIQVDPLDLGLWLRRQGLPLVPPLGSTALAVDLPLDQLAQMTDVEHVEVVNAAADHDGLTTWPRHQQAVLRRLAAVLRAADSSVAVMRTDRAGGICAAAISRGVDAVLIVDRGPAGLRVAACRTDAVATELVGQLPPVRPARLTTVDVESRALDVIGDALARGRTDAATNAFAAAGVPRDVAALLSRLDDGSTARGTVCVFDLRSGLRPAAVGGDWFETPQGAVLKWAHTPGRVVFAPADRSALVRLVASALADVATSVVPTGKAG